ncbi:hypothetical protein H6F38_14550 [Paenibacillus sp. EKM208P]|nr:hypothetical protein H6F38_14550 [Paenibacillus sp. EKM208P]
MSVIDSIKAKIEDLREDIIEINEQIEDDFNPMDWSGGNFDDCYDLGYGHGKKFGRMAAYKEILSILESDRQ